MEDRWQLTKLPNLRGELAPRVRWTCSKISFWICISLQQDCAHLQKDLNGRLPSWSHLNSDGHVHEGGESTYVSGGKMLFHTQHLKAQFTKVEKWWLKNKWLHTPWVILHQNEKTHWFDELLKQKSFTLVRQQVVVVSWRWGAPRSRIFIYLTHRMRESDDILCCHMKQ